MSEDKPKIRLHRYERTLAVKWPGGGASHVSVRGSTTGDPLPGPLRYND